jgi:nucleoside-triphosphatase
VREKGVRKGFKLVDLVSGREDWLARVNSNSAVRVGKYGVIVDSIDNFARNLGCENSELAIIDEIGPMELKSKVFVSTIEDLLSSSISCLFSIHLRSRHRLLERIRREFEVFTLSEDNRNTLVDEIVRLYENSGR